VEIRSAVVQGVDFAERVIELIVVPYDEETVIEYRGKVLRESVAPGAFLGIEDRGDHVTANREHDYARTFGKAVDYRHDNPVGLIARVKVSETPLGDETLRLADDGVLKGSVGMVVRRSDQVIKDGLRRIKRGFLDHIALVPNPAYRGAGVLAVRQGQQVAEVVAPPTPNLDAILALLDE
jgi:HK97 family phage prohead protease